MKLSIIIPFYNTHSYTDELLKCLDPQLNDDVEVILVDDGSREPYKTCYKWLKLFRQNNGGVSRARNKGLDEAQGEYISFIDSDDLVAPYYVEKLLEKISVGFDYLEFSWKSVAGAGEQYDYKLNSMEDKLSNPSVCTRAFNRAFIGDLRFNEQKDSTEDEDFTRRLDYNGAKREVITEYMYFYRTSVPDSKSKLFIKGRLKTQRIVYHYPIISADMTDLLDEIIRENEQNEVFVVTNKCEIPDINRYVQMYAPPAAVRGHELRGEPYSGFIQLPRIKTINTQVVLYSEVVNKVGGISTFIYNFVRHMSQYYDILVLYGDLYDLEQAGKVRRYAPVLKNNDNIIVNCDTFITQRIFDKMPTNIKAKKIMQMVHATYQHQWRVPHENNLVINVSEYAKKTWGQQCEDSEVIHNLVWTEEAEKALILVSATRIGAIDKGKNDSRMRKLAQMLESSGKKYIWFNFSDVPLRDVPNNFINMPANANIQSFIKAADYLVQLSDPVESFSYSCIEALSLGTPIITTNQPALLELGYQDGVHGHTVPDDMDFDVNILWDFIPTVNFKYDNKSIIKKWKKILGNTTPKHDYIFDNSLVRIQVIQEYKDMELGRQLKRGEIIEVPLTRAEYIDKAIPNHIKII